MSVKGALIFYMTGYRSEWPGLNQFACRTLVSFSFSFKFLHVYGSYFTVAIQVRKECFIVEYMVSISSASFFCIFLSDDLVFHMQCFHTLKDKE